MMAGNHECLHIYLSIYKFWISQPLFTKYNYYCNYIFNKLMNDFLSLTF